MKRQSSILILVCAIAMTSHAQSIDERLDEERFLRGLSEYQLPEVLEHYMEQHPPADQVQAVLYQITMLRLRLADETIAPAEHRDAIEAILQARSELIDEHPEDPRHGVWLAEQASDLLFGLYPLEAAGLASEFGLVAPEHRERAAGAAAEILAHAHAAELEIEERILNLEGEPGYQEDIALQLQRRRLARDERDRRIPFLRGAGEYLHSFYSRSDDAFAQREGYTTAAELLAPLIPELEGVARTRAQLFTGLALARLGRFDEAEEHFRTVAAATTAAPIDIFIARMGGVINREVSRGPEAALEAIASVEERYPSPDDLFFRILLADRRLLTRCAVAEQAQPAQKQALLRAACDEYLSLLDNPVASSADPELLRTIIHGKLATVMGGDGNLEGAPAIAVVARADHLARDASTRGDAIDLLEMVLERTDLDAESKAAALFGLARAHLSDENWLEAARRFDQVAREFPEDLQAQKAIEIAATVLSDLHAQAPDMSEVETQFVATLALIMEQHAALPEIDRWRMESGRLHLENGGLDAAESVFESIAADAPWGPESRFMVAQVTRARAAEAAVDDAPAAQQAVLEAVVAARTAMHSAIQEASDRQDLERARAVHDMMTRLDVLEAEALLALNRPEETLARVAGFDFLNTDHDVMADALSLRIRAYQQAGRMEEARAEVDRFILSIPDEIDTVVPAMMAALAGDVAELLMRGDAARARERAEADLIPLAEALKRWLASHSVTADRQAQLLLHIGDAYRLAERHLESLAEYEAALSLQPSLLQAIFGRAEAYFALARFEEAMADFRRISAARLEARDEFYWRSELRMLQVLDRVNRNTQQIVPRIQRLRASDPTLGGLAIDFAILENKYAQ